MNEKLKSAYEAFYRHKYELAKEIFIKYGYLYEAGVSALLLNETDIARAFFEKTEQDDMAASFALSILNLIENKRFKVPSFFQIRAFWEIYINFFIESGHFDWAQRVIDNYPIFQKINFEVPKFTARVLFANNFYKAVHTFCAAGKETCFYDAEVHYIDASLYIIEKNYEQAEKCIKDCLSFAPEYFPIIKLKKEVEEKINRRL